MRHEYDPTPMPAQIRDPWPATEVDGHRHLIISIGALEEVAREITYPHPGPGWATAHIGPVRYAAWWAVPR